MGPAAKSILQKAADGCHPYGWIINLVVTIAMFAYFFGGLNTTVNNMDKRISNLESTMTQILLRDSK